ncbi:MAG: Gfo/Idh/MocA family oxidoreductase [Fimbriimonadales bacterium]|nr:Gfo/Idh/MocA family oxidoreductase [Fimbriimonadales bacterium]
MASAVRLGIIGVGNMGSHHVRSIDRIRRCRLTAVCDVVPSKMAWIEGPEKFEDSAALIRSGLVDAVLIATPHYDHTTIGIDALDNGLHVLTEKPISVHKADCERLIAAHLRHPELRFAAMFNQRTDPHYQRIRHVVKSGELGELQRVSWIITDWFRSEAYYASGGWRATWAGEGGGVLLNQCPHNLDLLQWICGTPCRVYARCSFGKYHNIEVEDEVTAVLEFPNGATGVFVTSTGEAPGTNRLEIVGDRGKLVYEGGDIVFDRTEVSVSHFRETTPHAFPTVPTWKCQIPASGCGGQHAEILQNFVDAILDGERLIAPAEEGIHSVEIANAMLLSAWKNEAVRLPLDGAEYEEALKGRIRGSTFRKPESRQAVVDMESSF